MGYSEVSFRSDIRGYSLRSSRDFTEVRPVLAAGGRLAHLPEPHATLLETALGTYADKTQLQWMVLASQADRGASWDVATEAQLSSRANSWRQIHAKTPLLSILLSNVRNVCAVVYFIMHYPEPLKQNFAPSEL